MAKVLALRRAMGCNAQSFNFGSYFPMHVKKRRLPNFEACSVALFASIALGGTSLPSRAQVPATPSSNSSRPGVPPKAGALFLPHRQLSRASDPFRGGPTAALEPIGDKDGSISSPNFDEALK